MLTKEEKTYMIFLIDKEYEKYKDELDSILGPPLKLFDTEQKFEEFHTNLKKKLSE